MNSDTVIVERPLSLKSVQDFNTFPPFMRSIGLWQDLTMADLQESVH